MKTKKEVIEVLDILKKENPNPPTELNYTNAYTLLVAILLSAQSTDKGVNKATEALFKVADTPQKMSDLGLEELKQYIKTIGLYNNKAQNIMLLSQRLIDVYNGEVPRDKAALESLAGVGRKTANVLLNVWWGEPTIAVDTHVMRVCERLDFCKGRTPLEIEAEIEALLPDEYKVYFNHWLVLFGRYVCKAKKPECYSCPISHLCKKFV